MRASVPESYRPMTMNCRNSSAAAFIVRSFFSRREREISGKARRRSCHGDDDGTYVREMPETLKFNNILIIRFCQESSCSPSTFYGNRVAKEHFECTPFHALTISMAHLTTVCAWHSRRSTFFDIHCTYNLSKLCVYVCVGWVCPDSISPDSLISKVLNVIDSTTWQFKVYLYKNCICTTIDSRFWWRLTLYCVPWQWPGGGVRWWSQAGFDRRAGYLKETGRILFM